MRIVVTGANRGIGLEFVRQYLARGDEVVAASRAPECDALRALGREHPGRLRSLACDVRDDASVRALADALGDAPVDVLVNNAGVVGDRAPLATMDMARALETYDVNALGPLRVTRALLPNLRRGAAKRVASVSSGMGSIGDNRSGGSYAYRMSKAALNMASRNLAIELAPEGIVAAAFNPGWVKTDMGGAGAPTDVAESVHALIARIDALDASSSGGFYDWKGPAWPW